MRRRYYRKNNVLRLSKTEKQLFELIVQIIRISGVVIYSVCIGIYSLGKYIRKMAKNYYALKNIGYNLDEILDIVYKISPRQFEIFCAELFKQHGYRVKLTAPTSDYGREICQKLLGSCQMFQAEKAIIITTGNYHKNAYECANMVDNLELMDVTDIQKMILDLKPDQISKVIMRTLNAS